MTEPVGRMTESLNMLLKYRSLGFESHKKPLAESVATLQNQIAELKSRNSLLAERFALQNQWAGLMSPAQIEWHNFLLAKRNEVRLRFDHLPTIPVFRDVLRYREWPWDDTPESEDIPESDAPPKQQGQDLCDCLIKGFHKDQAAKLIDILMSNNFDFQSVLVTNQKDARVADMIPLSTGQEAASGKPAVKGKNRSGRKGASQSIVDYERELSNEWFNEAKPEKIDKRDFAESRGMTIKNFDAMLDRVRKRLRPKNPR